MAKDPSTRSVEAPVPPRATRRLAVYGKGGIGKSTIVANLAVLFAQAGKRVLVVGCDPKHDTSHKLTSRYPMPTVLGELAARPHELALEHFLVRGRFGIDCIEAGGPEPGVGCAGRGLSKMFELFETHGLDQLAHDVVLYDVLGDVVCGGFAVPLRRSHGAEVLIVVSGELMALYAANNICRALVRVQQGGARLLGLVGNLRSVPDEAALLDAFAQRIGTRVLQRVPRSDRITLAERERQSVVEHSPDSPEAQCFRELFLRIAQRGRADGVIPRTMSDIGFDEFVRHAIGHAS